MQPAICIENLAKQYRIGTRSADNYRTLRESVVAAVAAPFGRRARRDAAGDESFWALKDVSFEVRPGEVVGIIGRNGAGKSTLLKILSGITEPTCGRVTYRGRIASLLEVGTGFHPELTGRENIYLNGSILGMTRGEITRKFDEIVAFAEIGRFLDTPVKRYSSGMYVRLAFGVASTLEPEVLVVDEVLAVGDQAFQRKCLGRMAEISRSDRTVLFVSHNIAAVANLCRKVALLERGRLTFFGDSEEGISHYLSRCADSGKGEIDLSQHPNRRPGSKPIYRRLRFLDHAGRRTEQLLCGRGMVFELTVDTGPVAHDLHYAIVVEDAFGGRMFTVGTHLCDREPPPVRGVGRVVCRVEELMLAPGRYAVSLWAGPHQNFELEVIERATWFDVVEADVYANGRIPKAERGRFIVRSHWDAGECEEPACR